MKLTQALGARLAGGGPGYTYKAPSIGTKFFSQFFTFGNAIEGDVETILLFIAGIAFVIALAWYLFGIMGHRASLHRAKHAFIGCAVFLVLVVAWPTIFNAILAATHAAFG
jgi:hypothetical protein